MTGPVTPAGVDPRFERSVGRWLRAYPRRWRAVRAAELTAVLADLAAPGVRRLDVRSGIGLMRAGWATRWREHPPLRPWLSYRLLDRRMPAQHRAWVRDDLAGALLIVRTQWPFAAMMLFLSLRDDGITGFAGVLCGLVLVLWVFMDDSRRRNATRKHFELRAGEEPDATSIVRGWVSRSRYRAATLMPLVATVLTVGAVAGTVAAGFAHRRVLVTSCDDGFACTSIEGGAIGHVRTELVVLVAALLLGAALVPLARQRLQRLLPGPEQQCRWSVDVAGRQRTGAVMVVAFLCSWAAAEASGHLILLSTPVTLACCLLAPGAVAACLLIRARPDLRDVAAVDVWRAAVRGRAPRLDAPVPGYVPYAVTATDLVVPGAADAV
ncbi:hypothetical protein [Cellulomonas soli]|uniref:Uncharacterized protein n=1 Tax=Cellulomonas soli TaxID=931535 RepID=A0A512PC25_9CELL|nr:hypothetical protein [Cellulomonas soli]NYI58338.1 hypothetical protein [Cellulomonas soli]GEP68759.1 hypothetical protein CSO01_14740 [Cellulomonas soli]